MAKVTAHVSATHEETGERRWFAPGDDVPDEFRGSIKNAAVWESREDAPSGDETPDGEGGGGDTPPDATDVGGGDETPLSGEDANVEGETDDTDDEDEEGEEPGDNYDDLRGDDLRAELARRDLPVHGNKADLIERLRADDAEYDGEA